MAECSGGCAAASLSSEGAQFIMNSPETICRYFQLDHPPVSCEKYGAGHINRTFLVTDAAGKRYILQRVSENMTSDIPSLMQNIYRVTEHLKKKNTDPRAVLGLICSKDGKPYLHTPDGFWRCYTFVEHSICLQKPECDEDFRQSALAFGTFMDQLSDFPAEELFVVLPDFHNTPSRLKAFKKSVSRDAASRASLAEPEIEFLLSEEDRMGVLQGMWNSGALPVRVTHNDTKLNNVLLDASTRKALCVIDLDTVMPGLAACDFGDSIRFGASTAAEDEPDLDHVHFDLHRYEVFSDGFISAFPRLTKEELETLPLGAVTITLEQAVRFLGDYLDGDIYYSTSYPGQNLNRARTQIRLAQEMIRSEDKMNECIAGRV